MAQLPTAPNIFISYSREDVSFVERLANDLRTLKFEVWYDKEIRFGDDFSDKIEKALEIADYFLVGISAASVSSKWVKSEYAKALELKNSTGRPVVIPILLKAKSEIKMPLQLTRLNYVDFSDPEKYQPNLEQLREDLDPSRFIDSVPPPGNRPTAESFAALRKIAITGFGLPPPLPAFFWPNTSNRHSVAVDLGTIWGLDRSCFIGAVAGYANDGLFDGLQIAERVLSEAQRDGVTDITLQSRVWIKIGPEVFAHDGQSIEFLQDVSVINHDGQKTTFRDLQLAPLAIIGLFIEIPKRTHDDHFSAIVNWYRQAEKTWGTERQISMVMHVTTDNAIQSRQVLSRLTKRVSEIVTEQSIDAFILDPGLSCRELPPAAENDIDHLFGLEASTFSGFYFCDWMFSAAKAAGSSWQTKNVQDHFGPLVHLTRKLAVPETKYGGDSSALRVVSDLDVVAVAEGEDFHRQFLLLVSDYMPERRCNLIGAYARSESRAARISALKFAIEWGSDQLIDAWIAGNGLDARYAPEIQDLTPAPGEPVLTNGLVLGALRFHRNAANRDGLNEFLCRLRGTLEPDMQELVDLHLGHISPNEFFNDFNARKYSLALRSKALPELSVEFFRRLPIGEPDPWWLLAEWPTSIDHLRQILRMEPKQRAVLGLCTAGEWSVISSDDQVVRQILTCRKKRTIRFLHSKHTGGNGDVI